MKNWAMGILSIICIVCLVLCAVMYTDNRNLLHKLAEDRGGGRRFDSLLEICETTSQINKQQDSYLRRVRGRLEEIDEQQRERGDGKIWSASGPRKNGGPGKGRKGVGGP